MHASPHHHHHEPSPTGNAGKPTAAGTEIPRGHGIYQYLIAVVELFSPSTNSPDQNPSTQTQVRIIPDSESADHTTTQPNLRTHTHLLLSHTSPHIKDIINALLRNNR